MNAAFYYLALAARWLFKIYERWEIYICVRQGLDPPVELARDRRDYRLLKGPTILVPARQSIGRTRPAGRPDPALVWKILPRLYFLPVATGCFPQHVKTNLEVNIENMTVQSSQPEIVIRCTQSGVFIRTFVPIYSFNRPSIHPSFRLNRYDLKPD
jgi:hypothetical protein